MSSIAYTEVTARIVQMLEAGVPPWRKPWQDGAPTPGMTRPLRLGGIPYRGINAVNLWAAAQLHGYTSPYWLTYKAAQGYGGQVRKGERSELAFYVGRSTRSVTDDAGVETEESFAFLKAYRVFNASQCDGLPAALQVQTPPIPVNPNSKRHDRADAFIAASGATIRHGGNRAYYMPSADAIQLPAFEAFDSPEAYYGTALHELTHWTGPASRCDRNLTGRFGEDAYAAEELVAELGAAFLSADLRVTTAPREDHASYLAHWIKVLKADSRAIFRAASLAESACTYLHKLETEAEERERAAERAEVAAMARAARAARKAA